MSVPLVVWGGEGGRGRSPRRPSCVGDDDGGRDGVLGLRVCVDSDGRGLGERGRGGVQCGCVTSMNERGVFASLSETTMEREEEEGKLPCWRASSKGRKEKKRNDKQGRDGQQLNGIASKQSSGAARAIPLLFFSSSLLCVMLPVSSQFNRSMQTHKTHSFPPHSPSPSSSSSPSTTGALISAVSCCCCGRCSPSPSPSPSTTTGSLNFACCRCSRRCTAREGLGSASGTSSTS